MENTADLMLVTGVLARCCDCDGDQILMPVDAAGEYCCTVCDAAVVLWDVVGLAGEPGPRPAAVA